MTWTDEEIAARPPLPHPQNPLDLEPDQEVEFKIQNYELYRFTIHPRYPGAPASKDVMALRLYLQPPYRWRGLSYADATATKLVAQLGAIVQMPGYRDYIVRIKKIGEPPRAEFQVSLIKPAKT